MKELQVSLSPNLYPVYENPESIVVVIDVLRATTAICTAFKHGAKAIIPVATIEEAQKYKDKGFLVGAERNGVKVPEFDFGNSPYEYMDEQILKNKTIVLTTTNGTQAIDIAKNAYKVVVGSFANISVLSDWLIAENRSILLLCSGWKNRFNLEDTIFAGALIRNLINKATFDEIADSSICVRYLYELAQSDPHKFLSQSSHRRRLAKLNLKHDIKYCLSIDTAPVIPMLKDNQLVNILNK